MRPTFSPLTSPLAPVCLHPVLLAAARPGRVRGTAHLTPTPQASVSPRPPTVSTRICSLPGGGDSAWGATIPQSLQPDSKREPAAPAIKTRGGRGPRGRNTHRLLPGGAHSRPSVTPPHSPPRLTAPWSQEFHGTPRFPPQACSWSPAPNNSSPGSFLAAPPSRLLSSKFQPSSHLFPQTTLLPKTRAWWGLSGWVARGGRDLKAGVEGSTGDPVPDTCCLNYCSPDVALLRDLL